ncbi:MAG: YitT family protein [Deltaproteobacteria bacterium]
MNGVLNQIINEINDNAGLKNINEKGNTKYHAVSRKYIHTSRDLLFILAGIFSAGFGLKAFLLPNAFIDGGVTGISLILSKLTGISLSILIVIINIPFLIIGSSTINRVFALKSIMAIVGLAFILLLIPFPLITDDKLLISVFGGFFLGLGIGLSIRGGAVIDGTEILAIFLSRKTPATIGDIILIFNILIFSIAAYVFSVEIALYAILTYFAASKTVDFVVSGIEEYVGVTIISSYSEEIRLAIIENMGRGCTIYSGKKGFGKRGEKLKETDIVYTLVTRLELSKLESEIEKIDVDAFFIMSSIKDAKGGMIKKRPLTH